ncbi:family 16 glycoside hydrolase [Cesiribacter sp. SM1]|uniref:family 16 glycoside hydrolase n=1 Tax=Cesiribacter sp. SM1 TaxID=2861196 RepID=UPI001CD3043A|nr:family 16 glycoside hydrolase [Cesiribacter sp. SM1]
MIQNHLFSSPKQFFTSVLSLALVNLLTVPLLMGQTTQIQLNDLSLFQNPSPSWQIVGGVTADLEKENKFNTTEGSGVLVNLPDKRKKGKDLLTTFEHGDIDLELDYMMAKGANSGIYLQGLYELQLEDSWGLQKAMPVNNGGIYPRWDDSKPKGSEAYEGYAPRQQVSRAPGTWQHLKVSFQAPRFDASGNKTENAKLLRVELNGVTIHEDVQLTGPTRGALSSKESATGPLRIQGDHGAVAFRNMEITRYEKPRPELTNLQYAVYEGRFDELDNYDSIPPEAEGSSVILTSDLGNKSKQFLIRYTGNLEVKEAGEYTFDLNVPGGSGLMRINKQEVVPLSENTGKGTVTLPAGNMPFELFYAKYSDWVQPGLGLAVSGTGLRDYLISDRGAAVGNVVDPILVDAGDQPILRSFMDIPDGPRVTHAVSVGSNEQLHYTYDLDHGALVQLWRGGFLDATPMWHQRGDGSSRPTGTVHHLTKQSRLAVARLSSPQAPWVADTTGSAYKSKGYTLSAADQPTFRYQVWGADVQDAIRVMEGGRVLRRELSVQNPSGNLYMRLAEGASIQELSKGMYLIDDKSYYLRLDDAGGAKPIIRTSGAGQELIVPLQQKLAYSILY